MNTLTRRTALTLAAAALLGAATAHAQAPATPLRVILPVGAGSGVDTIVRAAQIALSKALGGQPVVIENLPGAGGITGTQALVKAAPDGNTVAFISNNHSVNPSVFKSLPYDSLNDITPITVVGGSPFVLVVNPAKVPVKSAKELQVLIKAKPGQFNMASSGNGTIIHLAGEMFVDALDVQVQHIPYKGMGPMLTDIMSGQVEFGVAAVAAAQGHLASGRLKAIGVMGKQRVPSLPDVPTVAEQGFPDVDVAGWFAMIGPKGLPAAQVKRLHDAVVAAFNDADVKASMAKQDNVINPTTPDAAANFLKTEQARYARLVTKANIKID
ncbi:Bug family tripartite tricarboxylate transporter substrate binding protein [Hydrogenophaga sp. OTU3427]|uniref:Bug family tripartite tricarboxylate transporter substrate binding protein n=1 Tax=Hydrogenophaga sp. OTU3427 TaxID=3043856 RepID=UPI00313BF7CE